jgi:hypothetical protein
VGDGNRGGIALAGRLGLKEKEMEEKELKEPETYIVKVNAGFGSPNDLELYIGPSYEKAVLLTEWQKLAARVGELERENARLKKELEASYQALRDERGRLL